MSLFRGKASRQPDGGKQPAAPTTISELKEERLGQCLLSPVSVVFLITQGKEEGGVKKSCTDVLNVVPPWKEKSWSEILLPAAMITDVSLHMQRARRNILGKGNYVRMFWKR